MKTAVELAETAISSAWAVPTLLVAGGFFLLYHFLTGAALKSDRFLTGADQKGRLWLAVGWALGGLVLSLSAVVVLGIDRYWPAPGGLAGQMARTCAALSLFWSIAAVGGQRWREGVRPAESAPFTLLRVAHTTALLLGVCSSIIQAVVLAMRAAYVITDLLSAHPSHARDAYGFGAGGLWALGMVFAACAISLLSTGDRRLAAGQLWSATLLASWSALLLEPLLSTPTGGVTRTGSTLVLLGALAGLMLLTALLTGWVDQRQGSRRTGTDPDELTEERPAWPGLSFCTATMAIVVLLLVCYHLAVPTSIGRGGFRLSALGVSISALAAAMACFALVGRMWSVSLADAGMGLTSLSLCTFATVAVPSEPVNLAERYPMLFNAMMVGLATGTGLWTYLACSWQQQLDESQLLTTTGRLIPYARRFAFLNAALALVVSAAMAIWPRWPSIAAMDHTFGRIAAGFAANLFLLLVMLWCSRRLHRFTFAILTVLAVFSGAAFLVVRMVPFSARFD